MNATECCKTPLDAPAQTAPDRAVLLAELDKSLRFPVLALLTSSLAWLVVGSVGLLIATVKLHAPGMLANCEHLTYGRLYPATMNALLYGFAAQAGSAVGLWILCRLGSTRLAYPGFAILGWFFWNIGLPIGLVGLLLGDTTGFEWFEMPGYATPILFCAYSFIGFVAIATFTRREQKSLYVSHWYLLAALFAFAWIYSAAQLLLVFHPLRGVMQAAAHGWAANGLFNLWLTPLGLAIVFYFIPKITERPLHHRGLALFGFWALVILGGWAGLRPGLPLPAGFVSTSVAAGVVMFIPLFANASNWQQTLVGQFGKLKQSLPLQFICAAALSYIVAALLGVLGSVRGLSNITNFTYLSTAQNLLLILGLLGMAVAGAAYYFVPRLAQDDFPCGISRNIHRFGSFLGLALLTVGLGIGGLVQGAAMDDAGKNFLEVVKATKPWLHVTVLGVTLIAAANGAFLFNLLMLIILKSRQCVSECVLPQFAAVETKKENHEIHETHENPSRIERHSQQPKPQQGQGKKRRKR